MHIHRFFRSHRKGLISVAVIIFLVVISVYQSIYADNDGIPTTTIYWLQETPVNLHGSSAWIYPHNGGFLAISDDKKSVFALNAGMSLTLHSKIDDPHRTALALFAENDTYRLLCGTKSNTGYIYSLHTLSADGVNLRTESFLDSEAAFLDCRMNRRCLALVTETQFLIYSLDDAPHLLYQQTYAGHAPQVCITEDTVLFSTSDKTESVLYEYSIETGSVRTAATPQTPLFALSAAPDDTNAKYLIGCGNDLLGLDEQFAVKERFLDLRETWKRKESDSSVIQTLSQKNIAAVHTVGTVLYITDTHGRVYKLDVFWGDSVQSR
ncbi:MAG: hypothetical protein E7604_13030 [Ruminococcaceae bacterium]|nr:hypothetical protein [Oscillospiraceae bacterium]